MPSSKLPGRGEPIAVGDARPVADRALLLALARAFAGAILFGLPLLMTMEMWTLGFAMHPERLALLLGLTVPLLTGLAYYGGFRHNIGVGDSVIDAFVAFLIGVVAAASALVAFGVLDHNSSLSQIVGSIGLEAVPCAMGAVLARSQLGPVEDDDEDDSERWDESYGGELLLMVAGALFFAFNVAPTEEVVLVAIEQEHVGYALVLMAASLAFLHAFVYALDFKGGHAREGAMPPVRAFFAFTLPGYALVLLTSFVVLWLFGRLDGQSFGTALHLTAVLGFPGALGAASARLIL